MSEKRKLKLVLDIKEEWMDDRAEALTPRSLFKPLNNKNTVVVCLQVNPGTKEEDEPKKQKIKKS